MSILLFFLLFFLFPVLFSPSVYSRNILISLIVLFSNLSSFIFSWRRGVVVITTAQLHSTKPELRFCTGSNPACGVSEIRDGEDLSDNGPGWI